MNEISFTIRGEKDHVFTAKVHESSCPSELQLGSDYYRTWGELPKGDHYELEIVAPGEDFLKSHLLNIHRTTDGRPFMCYPRPMQTLEVASFFFKVWSLGAVLCAEKRILLRDELDGECSGDIRAFLQRMTEIHKIMVV